MKNFAKSVFSRITFKRFVVLFILFLIALPIIKGVFFSSKIQKGDTVSIWHEYEYKYLRGDQYSHNRILAIPIQGMILTESSGAGPLDFLSGGSATYGYDTKQSLIRAADDNRIKGVLLQINSPGGTIPGSKAIAEGIEYYREKTGKPVYAHIRDVGASGAYWAAVATDKVIADDGSIVGSIGVLMGPFKYYDTVTEEGSILGSVTTQDGIESTYFTAGTYKDTGSPYRRMSEEEKTHWQNTLNAEYQIFVDHVAQYRKIPRDTIIRQVKALPYGTQQAKQLRLIDQIGSENDAIDELLLSMRVSQDDYQLIYEREKGDFFEELFSVAFLSRQPKAETPCSICSSPLYLYDSTYQYFK